MAKTDRGKVAVSRDAALQGDAYAWLWPIQGLVRWGEASSFEADSPQAGSGCEDWPGLTFPGWSVGRARLTLNQD